MTPEVFAEWFRRQGYRVVQTKSSYWVEIIRNIFQAIPYHWLISPSANELDQLFFRFGAIAVRYSTNLNSSEGKLSYHVVYEKTDFPLLSLPKKARHDVQRGLSNFTIRPLNFKTLALDSWKIRLDTLQRQSRVNAETYAWWERLCISAMDLSGFEAWGAYRDGLLVASLISFFCGDCCSILYQQSLTEVLKLGVNNALIYKFTNDVLNRQITTFLFYGLHSLDAPSSVDEFKFRMGYIAKPVRQRIVFHPIVAPMFNRLTHSIIKGSLKLHPGNPFLAKAEGMIRFYLEGKKPLDKQNIPSVLDRSVVDSLINK